MISEPKLQIHGLLALTVLFASGCQLARMELDPALADAPAMAVKGNSGRMWDRQLEFGPWRTASVKEGWTRDQRLELATSSGDVVTAFDDLSKRYRFDMSTSSGPVEAQCAQLGRVASRTSSHGRTQNSVEVDLAMLGKIPPLQCTYAGVGGGSLKLLPRFTAVPAHAGEVVFAGQSWQVTEVSRIEGARAHSVTPMSGFEVRRDGTVIAAVEVINDGRVWISQSLSRLDQDRAAVVVTTLLLFRPVEPSPVSSPS